MTYTREEMMQESDQPFLDARVGVRGDMIRQLLAENDALRALTEWQDIAEAPVSKKLGPIQMLLSHADKRWIRMGRFYPEFGKWYYSGTNERSQWAQVEGDEPTHFKPLGEGPK